MDDDELELFNLHKQVYVATKWRDDLTTDGDWDAELSTYIPEYTSDYLLGRLQTFLSRERQNISIKVVDGMFHLEADNIYIGPRLNVFKSESTLLNLLKLTLALSELGELKG